MVGDDVTADCGEVVVVVVVDMILVDKCEAVVVADLSDSDYIPPSLTRSFF
jgi:hypothetical protein